MTTKRIMGGLIGLGLILAAGLIVGTPSAEAITFDLTSDHCSGDGGCGTAPFGSVTLLQNGSTTDITVHLFSPNQFVKTGALDFMNFEFNGVDVVVGDIAIDSHSPGLSAATGAFGTGGIGDFAFGITCGSNCKTGGAGAFSPDIVFHVANATIADLTVPNSLGNVFVADIYGGATGNTGVVDATTPVPEPATLLLLGSGLMGMGWFGRKRLKDSKDPKV